MRNDKGSASIEMAAALPLVVLCMLVMVQIFGAFITAQQRLQLADARVAEAMRNHMSLDADHAFEWPCLERVAVGIEGRVVAGGAPRTIGAGFWRRTIDIPQEVAFVTEPICSD